MPATSQLPWLAARHIAPLAQIGDCGVGRWALAHITQAAGEDAYARVCACVYMCILPLVLRPAAGSRRSIRSRNFRFLGQIRRRGRRSVEQVKFRVLPPTSSHQGALPSPDWLLCEARGAGGRETKIDMLAGAERCFFLFLVGLSRDVPRGYDDEQFGDPSSLRWSVGQTGRWSGRNGRPGDAGLSVMDGFHWGGYAIGTN